MTTIKDLHQIINDTIKDNSISEEVEILQETRNGNSSLYTVKNKNGVTFWKVPGPPGFTDRGFVNFIQRDPGRPVLISGSAKISNTTSNAPAVSWPVGDITPILAQPIISIDASFLQNNPTFNANGTTIFQGRRTGEARRTVLRFDLSEWSGVTLSSGILTLTAFASALPATFSIDVLRLTRNDWVEGEATWNEYKSGSSWTAPGGDYTAVDSVSTSQSFLASQTDFNWIITALCQDAIDNRSGSLDLIVKANLENSAEAIDTRLLVSRQNTSLPEFIPRLVLS